MNYADTKEFPPVATNSPSFFKTLLENAFDGIVVVNYEGIVKYHSPSLLQILGYRPESGKGKSILELLHPDDLKVFQRAQLQLNKYPEKIFGDTVRFLHKKKYYVILEVRAINLKSQSGVDDFLINYRDITESKKIEKALKESEERNRSIVESAPETIFLVDSVSGNILDTNRNATKLFGYSRERLLKMKGIHLSPRFQPDGTSSLDFINTKVKEALKGETQVYEWMHKNSRGKLFLSEVRIVHFPPYNKKIIRGTILDITERKKIEQQLYESEARYRSLVEDAHETIFIIDAESRRIIDFNHNAVKLFGHSRSRLLRMRITDLSPKTQPEGISSIDKAKEKTREALRHGKTLFEWLHRKANGKTFPTEVYLSRFPHPNRKLLRGTIIDITEKKELERKLIQNELDRRHLTAVSPVGIFRTDSKGKTVYVNDKWCAITGLSAKEGLGTGWLRAVHAADAARVSKDWKSSIKQRKPSRIEFRFLTNNGETVWVLGEAVPDYDERGEFLGYAGSITDITERVLTEQALIKSEERNAVLLNAIPDLIFRISKSGIFLDFKPASGFKTIVPAEAFLGKKIKDILPASVAGLCMKNVRKALKTGSIQTYSYSLPDLADNSNLNYFEGRIISYDNNEVLALIRDVTQQQKAGILLKESEEKWRTLVKSAPQYIATIDKQNHITFINHLKTIKPEQIIGTNVFELLQSSDISKKDIKSLLDNARKNKTGSLELSVMNPLGKRMWFNIKVAPVKSNGKAGDLIAMALDITERKKAEEELRQSNEKLKALYQRLDTIREEEKKNIALEIHDELGQELTAIKLGMFWIQQYLNRQEDKAALEPVKLKIKSLIELSAQTISSARRLAHQLRPVVLDNLGLLPAIEWQIEKISGDIICSFRTNISNEKFTPEFSVTLFRIIQESFTNILRHSKATKVWLNLHHQNKSLVLNIEDNGIGIKSSDTGQPGKIGIFGIKERIQSWQGKLELSGKPGKGTILRVTFPLKEILKKK